MADETVFERMLPAAFTPKGGDKVLFPVKSIREEMANRVIPRERAYKNGAKLDDTGSKARTWTLSILLHDPHNEPDMPSTLYPDVANALCDAADVHETGDLQLPTRGKVRARFVSYTRVEDNDAVDAAAIEAVFQEDNEDTITSSSFALPSARAVSVSLAQFTTDSLAQTGSWSDLVSGLLEAGAELEGLANAPGEFADDLEAQANAIFDRCNAIGDAFANTTSAVANEVSTLLLHPEASRAGRLLARAADTAKRAAADAGAGATTTKTYPRVVSIFDVAADVSQGADKLLAINPGLGDPFAIAANTPIRVFAA